MNYSEPTAGTGKKLLADDVFQRIGQSIIDGTLAPGERIRDADLATEFNVSRMPIREALQRLERIGLVEMFPSRFTQVSVLTPETVASALEFAGFLSGAISRMTVPHLTANEKDETLALADALIRNADDPLACAQARWELFRTLSDHNNNVLHRSVVEEFGLALFRSIREWQPTAEIKSQLAASYQNFRDAVAADDGAAAERAARGMHLVDF